MKQATSCSRHSYSYIVTFDHRDITGLMRERCSTCGQIRWTRVEGQTVRIEDWIPGRRVAARDYVYQLAVEEQSR